jgi:hypothetical protein
MRSSWLRISLTRPLCSRASSGAEIWPVASSSTGDFRVWVFLANNLTKLIARHETNPTFKNQALEDAIALRRLDFVELLVETGRRSLRSTLPRFANLGVEAHRLFLDRGADRAKDSPVEVGFRARVRTALRAFLDCRQMHPEANIETSTRATSQIGGKPSEADPASQWWGATQGTSPWVTTATTAWR